MVRSKRVLELPDLGGSGEIVSENIRALQPIYAAAMLEELKVFQVVDRLVQLFQRGMLPINRKSAGRTLYQYWREAPSRLTEKDRRNLFSITLGLPGGEEGVAVNREFNELWLRFISRVSSLSRQSNLTDRERNVAADTDDLELRRSAVGLARNLSLHGAGMALFAASDLQKQIEVSIRILSDPEIRSAHGARDMWQVIDQIATTDLGGAGNQNRFRTMATTGATIISWLAANAPRLAKANQQRPIVRIRKSTPRPARLNELKFSTKATDADLVDACEQWLAVIGVSDENRT